MHVDQDRAHRRIVQKQRKAVGDIEAGCRGAYVHEVRRPAIGGADHVEGRQPKPRAVRHQSDIAVHLDVVELTVLGDALAFIVFLLFAQRGKFGMAKERVVVDDDLRVHRNEIPVVGQEQRIDLEQRGVERGEGRGEPLQQADEFGKQAAREAEALAEGESLLVTNSLVRGNIQALEPHFAGTHALFDILTAFRAGEQNGFGLCGVDEEREIEAARRGHRALDKNAVRRGAGRACLRRDEGAAKEKAGGRGNFVRRAHNAYRARLAALAGTDLRLDREAFAAEVARNRGGVLRGQRHAALGHDRYRSRPAASLPGIRAVS